MAPDTRRVRDCPRKRPNRAAALFGWLRIHGVSEVHFYSANDAVTALKATKEQLPGAIGLRARQIGLHDAATAGAASLSTRGLSQDRGHYLWADVPGSISAGNMAINLSCQLAQLPMGALHIAADHVDRANPDDPSFAAAICREVATDMDYNWDCWVGSERGQGRASSDDVQQDLTISAQLLKYTDADLLQGIILGQARHTQEWESLPYMLLHRRRDGCFAESTRFAAADMLYRSSQEFNS